MTTKTEDTALPSRRAMIGALAVLPVASVPALASVATLDPDPIFARRGHSLDVYRRISG